MYIPAMVVYCPLVRERRVRLGRRVDVPVMLFPGYCFVAIKLQWYEARWCPGVVRLLMDGEGPAHVPDDIIAGIRARERRGVVELPRAGLKIGSRVRIISGALSGRLGLYAGMASHERVAVLLTLLGAERKVQLNCDAVESV